MYKLGQVLAESVLKLEGRQAYVLVQSVVIAGVGVQLGFGYSTFGFLSLRLFHLALALVELVIFGWMIAIGVSMNSRVPEGLRKGFFWPGVGLAVVVAYLAFFDPLSTALTSSRVAPLILCLHLFSMFVNFLILWLCCRSLVAAEEGGKPPLERILAAFFVLWLTLFIPIGVWWIQNRARRVYGLAT